MKYTLNYNFLFEKSRIKLLLTQNPFFNFGLIGCILAFLHVSVDFFPLPQLIIWALFAMSLIVVRTLAIRFWLRQLNQIEELKILYKIEKLNALGAFASGLMWAVAIFYFFPKGETGHHSVMGFLLAGMMAAVSTGYAFSPKTFYAFTLPIGFSYIVALLYDGSDYHFTMAIMVTVYSGFLIMTFKNIHKFSMDSLCFGIEREHKLKQLSEQHTEVAYTSRMATLGELSANIAHEINNPLTILNAGLQIMSDRLKANAIDKDFLLQMCERLQKTVIRISETIKALKAYSRDNKDIIYESSSLVDITKDSLNLAYAKFMAAGIKLVFENPPEDIKICCYPVQIRQVIMNLINNAYDAVKDIPSRDKWVKISIHDKGENAILKVADSGPGIPQEIQQNIFQPFFTTKRENKGTGLGLSMVAGIIKKHQGSIFLNTRAVHTEFEIILPKKLKDIKVNNIAS